MRATALLLHKALKLTFFTRPNCSLCSTAKLAVAEVCKARQPEYEEIDISEPRNVRWSNDYEFDVPVLHIGKVGEKDVAKLMHRFTKEEVMGKMDEVDGRTN